MDKEDEHGEVAEVETAVVSRYDALVTYWP